MKIAFITEMGFNGKIPATHENMRTEFAWMHALDADHFNVSQLNLIQGYDYIFIIFPKGGVSLNSEGIQLDDKPNRFAQLYSFPYVETLKKTNKKVAYMQEGPSWYVNDFSITDQFNFYNQLAECDSIFTHNEYDRKWYLGLFPGKPIHRMPSLLIEEHLQHITPKPENKAIIGGGFCRWYGGFQSYMIAEEFSCPIHVPSMHNARPMEDQIPNLTHLPYMMWLDWMKNLSTYMYGVHMMPTVAAGTFSLNCAYFGIPCIGNIKVDTQRICHPNLSFEAEDIEEARKAAKLLATQEIFWEDCSTTAKNNYRYHYDIGVYKQHIKNILA